MAVSLSPLLPDLPLLRKKFLAKSGLQIEKEAALLVCALSAVCASKPVQCYFAHASPALLHGGEACAFFARTHHPAIYVIRDLRIASGHLPTTSAPLLFHRRSHVCARPDHSLLVSYCALMRNRRSPRLALLCGTRRSAPALKQHTSFTALSSFTRMVDMTKRKKKERRRRSSQVAVSHFQFSCCARSSCTRYTGDGRDDGLIFLIISASCCCTYRRTAHTSCTRTHTRGI